MLGFGAVGVSTVYANSGEGEFDVPHTFMTESAFARDFVTVDLNEGTASSSNMILYFQNLFTYSPINSQGSCGYVSFIQYLSYYDTFWNDNIIPESYDRNQGNVTSLNLARAVSPGVLRQAYPKNNLYEHIQNTKATDFQMYLMDIVNQSLAHNQTEYSYSIGMWNYYRILNALFPNTTVSFSYTRVQNFGSSAKPIDLNVINGFDSYVKGQLDLGKPVMLHIADYNEITGVYENYHSVVAYYYDTNGIHAHFGWGESSSDTIISSEYQITEAGVMSLDNISEVHSNNYLANNIEYCGCGYHVHVYNGWRYLNRMSHIEICECGARGVATRNHSVRESDIVNNKANCLGCGRLLDLNYDYANIMMNGLNCKYSVNGSFIFPSGIVVLVENDIDAYLNGTLMFYDLDQMPQQG